MGFCETFTNSLSHDAIISLLFFFSISMNFGVSYMVSGRGVGISSSEHYSQFNSQFLYLIHVSELHLVSFVLLANNVERGNTKLLQKDMCYVMV